MQKQLNKAKQVNSRKMMQRVRKSPLSARRSGHPLLQLQETIGNHGVLRHYGPTVQAKLIVGQPDDKYEQEADRVADRVLRMPERQVEKEQEEEELIQGKALTPEITPLVRRQAEEEEETEHEPLQTKKVAGARPAVSPATEVYISNLDGRGQPLPESLRAYFEPRFGREFSTVRTHAGAEAAKWARAVGARAFTVGHNIVFGVAEYAPRTGAGRKLLAHELTHVVQQHGNEGHSSSTMGLVQRAVGAAPQRGSREGPTKSVGFPTIEVVPDPSKRVYRVFIDRIGVAEIMWNGCSRGARVSTIWDKETNRIFVYVAVPEGARASKSSDIFKKYQRGFLHIKPVPCRAAWPTVPHLYSEVLPREGGGWVPPFEEPELVKSPYPSYDTVSTVIHTALDIAGCWPALGVIPDAINTGYYLIEGDWGNAGFSVAAMVPLFGQGATVTKYGVRVSKEAVEKIGVDGLATGLKGIKSRPSKITTEEIQKHFLEETGKQVPVGTRAIEESGMSEALLQAVRHKHHVFVQQLRKWFKDRGIDIDKYTIKLSADEHRLIHNEYNWNGIWKEFMKANPTASKRKVFKQMREMLEKYGLKGLPIGLYK